MPKRESELLMFLALESHPRHREGLIEALYPAHDFTDAHNLLKVRISRIRDRLNDKTAISSRDGTYRLDKTPEPTSRT